MLQYLRSATGKCHPKKSSYSAKGQPLDTLLALYLLLATLRYKPFRYNTKNRYGTGIYKRTKDITV